MPDKNNHFVIILAAGQGKRMNTNNLKQFLVLGKKPVLMHSLITFYKFEILNSTNLLVTCILQV